MSSTANEIIQLLDLIEPSAPAMTSALKEIGNGSMNAGIKKMFQYALEVGGERGMIIGEKIGFIKGSLATTAVIGGIAVIVSGTIYIKTLFDKKKRSKCIEQEGNEILEALSKAAANNENIDVVSLEEISDDNGIDENIDKKGE